VNVEKPSRELKGLQFVFIELSKFKPNNKSQRELRVLWLRFMSEINEKTLTVDPKLLDVPEIREAIELTEEVAYTPAELEAYNTYWDTVSNEKTLLHEREQKGKAEGRAEGLIEGEKKGKAEGNAEILLILLQQKFQKVPEIYNQKILQANPQFLKKWAERVLKSSTIENVFKDE